MNQNTANSRLYFNKNMEENKETALNDVQSLATIFKDGLNSYNSIIHSDQPTNSHEWQVCTENLLFSSVNLILTRIF